MIGSSYSLQKSRVVVLHCRCTGWMALALDGASAGDELIDDCLLAHYITIGLL